MAKQPPFPMRGLSPWEEMAGEVFKAQLSLATLWWKFWFGRS